MSTVTIVIPTFNEAENIEKIISSVHAAFVRDHVKGEIVVIDDNSADGTAEKVEKLKNKFILRLIRRNSKKGLASAILEGFRKANGDILGVIDADLSHNPAFISDLIKPILNGRVDLSIGSRYIPGGQIKGWSFKRKVISKGAILLATPLTPIKDPVSGFFFLKRGVIEKVEFRPKGYKICLEIIVKGNYGNVVEIPYTFTDRKHGKSKLGIKEYYNYLSLIFDLYWYTIKKLFTGGTDI